jgi:electron transfer flavoprotein alpha/beta subunit
MRIIVCVKQVPDTKEVQIDPITGTLIRTGVPSIMNPDDKNALEESLRIKEQQQNVEVVVFSMGPPQAETVLREAYAMGADQCILLTDRAFAGSDTWATSKIISSALKKIGNYDIIFCGRQAIDGDTAQVGPQIAEFLNIPQITYVKKLEIKGGKVIAHRAVEDGYYEIEAKMPVLLTAIKELNKPRYPSVTGIYDAYREKNITVWGLNDIDVDRASIGLKGSPTRVKKTFPHAVEFNGEMLKGSETEMVNKLIVRLKERQLL